MVYRVIQWATGGVGRAAVEGILRHPELELAGCWVHSADKHGVDVGKIVGTGPLGITATTDPDEILATDADCVIYAPMIPRAAQVAALLRSGKNVVSPVGWFYPPPAEAEPLAEACRIGAATLHGTGINPGGITELHPLMFSALSSAVTYVRGEEYSDIRSYGAPAVVRDIMRFGGTPEQAMTSPMVGLLSGGFVQSVQMCCAALGIGQAQIATSQQVAVATAPIDSPIGPIAAGQVAAQRFAWEAQAAGGQTVVRVAVNWLMGERDLDPPWTLGEQGERFEVEVRGDPSCLVVIKGWQPTDIEQGRQRNPGIVATAMHCVNSVPYVCRAEPGIKTYLDLPLICGRAHSSLLNPT